MVTGRAFRRAAASTLLAATLTAFSAPAPAAALPPNTVGPGYTTQNVTASYPQRVVRVAPGTAPRVRTAVHNVVGQINSAAGYAFLTVGPDLVGAPATHEILVRVPTVVNCGAAGAGGCASSGAATLNGQRVVTNATIDVDPVAATNEFLLPVLLHEMGHAVGLAHHDQPHVGEKQMMAPGVNAAMTTYRTGDRNGIRALVDSYNLPNGNFEAVRQVAPGRISVQGWTFDSNQPATPVDLHVYVDGRLAGAGRTAHSRPDVSRVRPTAPPTTGFSFPVTGVAAGNRTVCVYAINAGLGATNPRLGCRNVPVGGNPFGAVDLSALSPARTLTISGWAIDPDTVDPVSVHVYVDGRFARQSTANLSRADVAAAHPGYGPGHGYTVTVAGVSAAARTVCVYAINAGVGATNPRLGCKTLTAST